LRFGRWRGIALAVVVVELAAQSACSQTSNDPSPAPKDASSRQNRVPGEYLVTLAPGADVKTIADVYGRFGIKGTRELGKNLFLVIFAEDPGPAKLEELRGQNAKIKAVQPNFIYRSSGRGNVQ
jgi:hypothetical protein